MSAKPQPVHLFESVEIEERLPGQWVVSGRVLLRCPSTVVALFPGQYEVPEGTTRTQFKWVELYRGENEKTARGVLKAYARATRNE